jgi:hypothetical protein
MTIGTLQEHKFDKRVVGDKTLEELSEDADVQHQMRYLIKVCVDHFMALVILTTRKKVIHVGRAVMHGIHDVFPEDYNDSNNPISKNKLF